MSTARDGAGSPMTRVWLWGWEWSCCGEPFAIGDTVDFAIETREPHSLLIDILGAALTPTVDAIESHHEHEFPDRIRGRVVAVHMVTREVIERRSLRRPGHGAPLDATMPAEGEDWPFQGRDLGNGLFVGTVPSRYIVEIVPVPDTAVLEPAIGVRLPTSPDTLGPPRSDDAPPPETRARSQPGWLVDLDEHSH